MVGLTSFYLYSITILFSNFRLSACDNCEQCQKIVSAFSAGLDRTATKGFSGGNTHWEQRNIGSYATSEIRFDDIIAGVCVKSDYKCHEILGVLEPLIYDWWNDVFKINQSKILEFGDYLCLTEAKYCCPAGHFGPACNVCSPCVIQGGSCDGNGTRGGSGKCICREGYVGEACNRCNSKTHYSLPSENGDADICLNCHASCLGGCRGPDPSDCTGCAAGWTWIEEEESQAACKDVDECQHDPCERSTEYCLNTAGSYECHRCSVSCDGCHGPSAHDCARCRQGYHLVDGKCEDVDECSRKPSPCQGDGETCRNTPGSYVCECYPHLERRDGRCTAKQSGNANDNAGAVTLSRGDEL
ncbi:calcium binding EGF domain protein [Opisthorchis viverrini]|uniref:Uncharacterized protein n=2 Tax=Opisthorchis viverrini TaxID=6198 RepID=A0A074ZLL3_OPIVI|nr:hypothetical protein T265_08037 [Opisthorchis viverrini]KER24245.1 hypothetical protein T265_08037 [Opisthorchis viverrini]OON23817.1 calcium binding EGF domain protein [Opisthorchis viverrini]